jgi:hypothetical protein
VFLCFVFGSWCLVGGVWYAVLKPFGSGSGDGYLDESVPGMIIVVDNHDLLPGSQA